jgi:hypothetical protein
MIADTQYFTFRDIVRIAALLEVDEMEVLNLAYRQYIDNKKSKRKK